MNKLERKVRVAHKLHGWRCLKTGWPDNLFYKEVDGKIVLKAVEVKSRKGKLTCDQFIMASLLSRVIPVYIVKETRTGKLVQIPFEKYDDVRRY